MRGLARFVGGLVLVMGFALPQSLSAQEEGTRLPIPHENVISANPFLLLFEWVNVEFEHKVGAETTVGAIGSSVSFDDGDVRLAGASGFLRYYPQGSALSGFYLEGRIALLHGEDEDGSGTVYGPGIHIGYNWLFGANRNFYLSMGLGVTRLFGEDIDGRVVLPEFRLLKIGIAF